MTISTCMTTFLPYLSLTNWARVSAGRGVTLEVGNPYYINVFPLVEPSLRGLRVGFDSRQLHQEVTGQGYRLWPVFFSASSVHIRRSHRLH